MTILDLIQSDGFSFKKVSSTGGGEYAGSCPWCGGDDRFRLWPGQGDFGTYWCRGCGRSGYAIQYLRDHRRLTYQEACHHLGRGITFSSALAVNRPTNPQWQPREPAAPGHLWQEQARSMVEESERCLFLSSALAQKMLAWLKECRGLSEATIKKYRLGLVPFDKWESYGQWGLAPVLKVDGTAKKLWIPRGLIIPFCQDGKICRIRIRRFKADGDPRYYLLRGSDTRAMVLGIDKSVSVLVESELDGLLLHQEAGDLVNIISLGNAQSRPDQVAAEILNQSQLILVSLDTDKAGATESWQWWQKHYPQAHRWPSILGKDPGEMQSSGVNLRTWVEAGLTQYAANLTSQSELLLNIASLDGGYFSEGHLKPVLAVPVINFPVPQDNSLTCADCSHFEANKGPNPREGWGYCQKRRSGRYGFAMACEATLNSL
jgi:DNA primase